MLVTSKEVVLEIQETYRGGTWVKALTVLESSLPDSMILKHKGMISVVRRKLMTSGSSVYEVHDNIQGLALE